MPILMPMELPPGIYAAARDDAAQVVVIDVVSVEGLNGAAQGACTLTGTVSAVERGDAAVGAPITLAIPCIGPDWQPRPGPWPGFEAGSFVHTTQGRAYLDARGVLVRRGFDVLSHTQGD